MPHRIRSAMMQLLVAEAVLKGVVEVDETYIGGRTKGNAEYPTTGHGQEGEENGS